MEDIQLPADVLLTVVSLAAGPGGRGTPAVLPRCRRGSAPPPTLTPSGRVSSRRTSRRSPAPQSRRGPRRSCSSGCAPPAPSSPMGSRSAWLDRESGAKCYMVAPRTMWICWSDVPDYWRWIPRADSRVQECVELLAVCWLDMNGNIASAMLSKNTRYAAYLVFKMADDSYGLHSPLQEASITIGEVTSARPVRLQSYTDYEENDDESTEGEDVAVLPQLPRERPDGWMELEIGDWYNSGGDDGVVHARVKETIGGNWKKGLIVQGLEIRPKND